MSCEGGQVLGHGPDPRQLRDRRGRLRRRRRAAALRQVRRREAGARGLGRPDGDHARDVQVPGRGGRPTRCRAQGRGPRQVRGGLAFAQALPSPGSRARVRAGARRQAGLPHRARVRPPLGADGRGRPRACPDRASGHGQDLRGWLPGQLLDPRRQGAARDQRLPGGKRALGRQGR